VNVVFITIDSLSRDFLKTYGQPIELDVQTPSLDRFAERAVTFDRHYAGSLPCMPARRELLAGIQEFLWRPWGPLEPYDQPLQRLAGDHRYVTQLVTDHFHYFEHGSHGYFTDFHGWEFIRGHEVDHWQTAPIDPDPVLLRQVLAIGPDGSLDEWGVRARARYARNVAGFRREEDFFPARVFSRASEWLEQNHRHPKWFLYIDSFDVHEPFHVPEPYASMYTDEDPRDPELVVWPHYGRIDEGRSRLTERQVAFARAQFAGKITMVDRWLGHVLETLDRLALWDSTMVVITTDHGHYLGEHGWMGKPRAPLYDTLARIPLFVWHPQNPQPGRRVDALTASIDLYATLLDAMGIASPSPHSRTLMPLIRDETREHRSWALYGYWGSTVNVTDGRYTYLHPCDAELPASVTSSMLMNPYPRQYQPPDPPREAEAGHFLPYTDVPVWRFSAPAMARHDTPILFDVTRDPGQRDDRCGTQPDEADRMRRLLVDALEEMQAPTDLFTRLGLEDAARHA